METANNNNTYKDKESMNINNLQCQQTQEEGKKQQQAHKGDDMSIIRTMVNEFKCTVEAQSKQIKRLGFEVKKLNKELKVYKQQKQKLMYRLQILEEQTKIKEENNSISHLIQEKMPSKKEKKIDNNSKKQPAVADKKMQEQTNQNHQQWISLQKNSFFDFSFSHNQQKIPFIEEPHEIRIWKFKPHKKHIQNEGFEILNEKVLFNNHITDQNWHNFIMGAYLKTGFSYVITLNIMDTYDSRIQLGIISQYEFGMYNTLPACIVCDVRKIKIWNQGLLMSSNASQGLGNGDSITMRVDRINQRIEWFKKGRNDEYMYLIGSTNISENLMQENDLFITISFLDFQDRVKIMDKVRVRT